MIEREQLTSDPRYDDRYLLRFLRARQFDLEKTGEMFKKFLEWRKENGADDCLWTVKFPEMPELLSLYLHGYHGTDKEGRPFYYDCPAQVNIDDVLHKVSVEKMQAYYMREYERLLHVRLPACSAAKGEVIDTTTSCLDMKGFSMGMLNSKTKNFVMIAIQMGQDYYPEIMHEMLIINCPLMFRAAWTVFKPFIDEKTRKKIHILGTKF